jgi:hypothetical protein
MVGGAIDGNETMRTIDSPDIRGQLAAYEAA